MSRPNLPKVRSRERVTWAPNFRDYGRTVDRPVLALLGRLQQRYGQAWASEGGLRRMIGQDTGHVPGVTTLAKALVRLGLQGLLVQVWVRRGQILPDGSVCTHGTRLVWLPQCRRERHAARRFAQKHDRREGYETRLTAHQARELVSKLARPPAPVPHARDPHATERQRQLAMARAWIASEEQKKPPD